MPGEVFWGLVAFSLSLVALTRQIARLRARNRPISRNLFRALVLYGMRGIVRHPDMSRSIALSRAMVRARSA